MAGNLSMQTDEWVADSIYPDQTLHFAGLIWVYTICSDLNQSQYLVLLKYLKYLDRQA